MSNDTYFTALTIAGSDSSGGAGIQADLKTFSALGIYGMSVITALTAQNTKIVTDIMAASPEIVGGQIDTVFDDIVPDAVKIGMLFNAEIINVVADKLIKYTPKYIVLDPVMISTSGSRLIDENAINTLVTRLFPIASIITPNKLEAEYLTNMKISSYADLLEAGNKILKTGAKSVLIKGGHFNDSEMTDYYFHDINEAPQKFSSAQISTNNTHGTGCTLSSAIASFLAMGYEMPEAIGNAKNYLSSALHAGAQISIGHGHGPVNHLFNPTKLKIKKI